MKRCRVLIADSSEDNRNALKGILESRYEILEAASGGMVLSILRRMPQDIHLLLINVHTSQVDGMEVLKIMKENQWICEIPVILISEGKPGDWLLEAFDLGATDYISPPFRDYAIKKRVMNTIMLYADFKRMADLERMAARDALTGCICKKEIERITEEKSEKNKPS